MPTLYVTEPRSVVRRSVGSIVVTLNEDPDGSGPLPERQRRLLEVEPHRLELIALVGHVHITADVLQLCLEQGTSVAWLQANGNFMGRLVPELSRTADLRLAQFRMAADEPQALALTQTFISAKLHNAVGLLTALRSNRRAQPALGRAIGELKAMIYTVAQTTSQEELLGFEGDAARRYFAGLRLGFNGAIDFGGRARRPPPDPANALLSFGYVLLANVLASLLEACGFDPYLGFMHTVRSGRPSLALDLLEELRHPVVDRFVLRVCNRGQLRPEHFETDAERGGVRLTREGLRLFFRTWEAFMDTPLPGIGEEMSPEEVLRRQVDRLAAHVRGQTPYQPLLLQ